MQRATGGIVTNDVLVPIDNTDYMPKELYAKFEALAEKLAHLPCVEGVKKTSILG